MPESTENLILEHLRQMRAAVDRLEQRLDDFTMRVGLETSFTRMQTNLALSRSSLRSYRFGSTVSRQVSRGSKVRLNWLKRKVPGERHNQDDADGAPAAAQGQDRDKAETPKGR